jgi:hypothetical protein
VISLHNAVIVAYQARMQDDPAIILSSEVKTVVFGKSSTYLIMTRSLLVMNLSLFLAIMIRWSSRFRNWRATTNGNEYAFTFRNKAGELYTVNLLKNLDTGLFGITFRTYEEVDPALSYPIFTINDSNIAVLREGYYRHWLFTTC